MLSRIEAHLRWFSGRTVNVSWGGKMLPESTGGCAPYVESTEGIQEARGRKRHRRALGEDVGPRLPLQSLPVQRGCTQDPATSVNASCLPGIILSWLISCVNWTTVSRYLVKHCCCCSVTKLCPNLCDPMGFSMPGFPVLQGQGHC